MPAAPAVRARSVVRTFGDVLALDGVDLDVPAGEVHGLVGPNGAGKTTLLGLVLGLAAPDAGTLEIGGEVAGFLDGPSLYPALTARQNLTALERLRGERGAASRARVSSALDRVGLIEVADDRVRGFSLGMRQRLALAAAFLTEPRLLVLDEPANGLDPSGKRQIHGVISDLAAAGATVLLSSHRMDDLTALCREVTLLAAGRVVFSGPLTKLAAESGDLDYRLVTTDPATTRRVAAAIGGVTLLDPEHAGGVLVHACTSALDTLVAGLVRQGVAIRELAPVTSPLEAAFLALTERGGVA
ncbi:MAG TPA: ABC transporter ATP-binding protein [Nocardioides sp.]|nr:ABC transporter ATP-binding protein [Nocardioides sp.]